MFPRSDANRARLSFRSVTRWGYWHRILDALSYPEVWARLQQLLLHMMDAPAPPASGDSKSDDDEDSWIDEEDGGGAGGGSPQERALDLLKDAKIHAIMALAAQLLAPLCEFSLATQHSTASDKSYEAMVEVYKNMSEVLDDDTRADFVSPARKPLQKAVTQSASVSLVPLFSVTTEPGSDLKVDLPSDIKPVYNVMSVQQEKATWKELLQLAERAADAGGEKYNQRMLPVVNFAERRHVASLSCRPDTMEKDAFTNLLDDDGALPHWYDEDADDGSVWRWCPGGIRATGANAPHRRRPLKNRLSTLWREFTGVFCELSESEKREAGLYWLRTRDRWGELSELMLYWLCTPISTACVERGFSFMTAMDSNTRRRLMQQRNFRANFLAHLFKPLVQQQLSDCLHSSTRTADARARAPAVPDVQVVEAVDIAEEDEEKEETDEEESGEEEEEDEEEETEDDY